MNSLLKTIYQEEIYEFSPPPTVVLERPWSEQPAECREALKKLLAGRGLSPESVRMMVMEHFDLSTWAEVPAKLVAFINPPRGVALNELIQTPRTEMVITEPLPVLLADEARKRRFWEAFKLLLPA